MKTTIVLKDNRKQIVLTPEDDFEEGILKSICEKDWRPRDMGMPDKEMRAKVFRGSVFDCQGGWTRLGTDDNSLIILLEEPKTIGVSTQEVGEAKDVTEY